MAYRTPASRGNLRYIKPGEQPSASQWNAFVDYTRGLDRPAGEGEFQEQFGSARRRLPERSRLVRCKSDDDAPAYSIMTVYDGVFDHGNYYLKVKLGTPATPPNTDPASPLPQAPQIFAGNEKCILFEDHEGWVKIVSPYEAVRICATEPLQFLDPAGPDPDTPGKIAYDSGGLFMCVTGPDNTIAGSKNITGVISLVNPPMMVGKTTGSVSQGSLALVNIYGVNPGAMISDWNSLIARGDQIRALFLFGGAERAGMWVGVSCCGYMWVAHVIECPAVS